MKNIDHEKILLTVTTVFMLGFGISSAQNVTEFLSGCCAGAAALITYVHWKI